MRSSGFQEGCCGSQSHVYPDTSGDLKELRTEVWEPVLSQGLVELSLALSTKNIEGLEERPSTGDLGAELYDEGLLPICLTQVNQAPVVSEPPVLSQVPQKGTTLTREQLSHSCCCWQKCRLVPLRSHTALSVT